jgi:uncharacterized protein
MRLKTVVSDTSPIRALAHLERLDLVGALFDEVLIPPAVVSELENPTSSARPVLVAGIAHVRVQAVRDRSRVDRFRLSLDPGESEAIALALEAGILEIIIDERIGRRIAKESGLATVGVLGLLVRGKQRGHVQLVQPLIDRLRSELRFRVTDDVYATALQQAGEA